METHRVQRERITWKALASRYIHRRRRPKADSTADGGHPRVPAIVWMLWLQGWGEAPALVRACASSWRRLNPAWDVRQLTEDDVREMLPPDSTVFKLRTSGAPLEAVSDLVRLELLASWGGVWVDATVYCLRPLDDWLPSVVTSGFFAFEHPAPDRLLATWFLAASSGCPVVSRWRDLAEDYWAGRAERDDYFWVHHLFRDAYESDTDVSRVWDTTPKLSALPPHAFTPYQETLYGPVTTHAKQIVSEREVPVLKLTHKLDPVDDDHDTIYRWLCDLENG